MPAKHKLCFTLPPSLQKETVCPSLGNIKYSFSVSACRAETSLHQSILDFYSSYKYSELSGTNYAHSLPCVLFLCSPDSPLKLLHFSSHKSQIYPLITVPSLKERSLITLQSSTLTLLVQTD